MRKFLCIFEFWYVLITRPADKERASYVHERFAEYMNSALYLFIASVFASLSLGIGIHGAFILLLAIFGFQLPLVLVMTHRENNRYWSYRKADLDEELARMAEEAERRWRRTQRDFEERMRRAREDAERRRQAHWDDVRREFRGGAQQQQRRQQPQQAPQPTALGAYLGLLGLPATCRDFATIKKAYRALAKKYHPDVNKAPDAEKKFKEVKSAYDALERVLG